MFKLLGNKRLFILLIGLIFFIALMGLTLNKREPVTWPEKFVKDSISWMQGLIYRPARYIAGFFEDIHDLRVVYEENKALKRTLAQYARDTVRLNELEAQNKRLKEALGFTERQKQYDNYTYRIAEIVAVSPDPNNSTLVINLGEKDGIKENMAVVSVDGLVGRVVRVFPFHANVQPLTNLSDVSSGENHTKAIAATIKGKETESFGIIESYDEAKGILIMNKISQNDQMQVGDTVVTSGLGQVFPHGIVIGTVASRKVGAFGITYTANVKPAVDFTKLGHLREVFVIEKPEMR